MKYLYICILIILLALPVFAQTTGTIQYMGDKAILQIWGTHYQRGHAQGYLLGPGILDVFNRYYYTMVTLSDPVYYNFMWNYYQEHFDIDARMLSEAQGMIAGMQEGGVDIYWEPLERNLGAEDILLANALVDMIIVRQAFATDDLQLGCASLSSWGISTQADSLLAGSAVITRFLDWSQNSALIANPVLVVHHPAESDEQEWLSITFPGFIGALSAISEAGTAAFLNMGNDNSASNLQGLDPVVFDLRRGIERLDYNADSFADALDVTAAIQSGNHLSGTIIHCLTDDALQTVPVVAETNNSGTALRYYNQNGSLPGNHLAATNHFRVLISPTCCSRYANIQDSLYANPEMSAKRQWRVLSGAAGLETNLSAIQYTPATGAILWSSAQIGLPAYGNPAITLSAPELFSYNVSADDDVIPPAELSFICYPNPLSHRDEITLKSSFPFDKLDIFNVRGQRVFTLSLSQKQMQNNLTLPHLDNGIYLLRLQDSDGKQAQKKLVVCR